MTIAVINNMASRRRQRDGGGLTPLSMACENCPKYMYNFETVRETWMRDCQNKGRHFYERIRYFFKYTFDRYLKDIVFVIAYDVDHNAGVFLDSKANEYLKEKVQKAVELVNELTDAAPVMISRKIPRTMRIFTSLKDFILLFEQLRVKSLAIARQRYTNGLYLLERINAVMEGKDPLFLAFNAKISEDDSKQILQIGCVVFSLKGEHFKEKYHFYHPKANLPFTNTRNLQDTRDECNSPFKSTEMSSLAEVLRKLQEDISRVDFLVTYSMSSEGIRNFLRTQGLDAEAKEAIDTLTIHSALFHESRKESSMKEILRKLEIPFEDHKLLNAAYNAVCITKIFRGLLSQEFSICLSV